MLLGVRGAITKCEKTVTTTSGSKAPNEKKLCSGDLIFEETFDGTFDLDNVWQHDISFNGNGVRLKLFEKCRKNICGIFTENGISMVFEQSKHIIC